MVISLTLNSQNNALRCDRERKQNIQVLQSLPLNKVRRAIVVLVIKLPFYCSINCSRLIYIALFGELRNPHLNQIPPDGTRAHERNR